MCGVSLKETDVDVWCFPERKTDTDDQVDVWCFLERKTDEDDQVDVWCFPDRKTDIRIIRWMCGVSQKERHR